MATSSSDAIRPVSASDPDAVAMPSAPPTPSASPRPSTTRRAEADPLAASESGEVDLDSGPARRPSPSRRA